jgi:hypothetical protein
MWWMRRLSGERLRGTITAVGLPSGDRIAVGAWRRSPIGPFTDAMWVQPDDVRVLLAPDEGVANYVSGIYAFERIEIVPFSGTATASSLSMRAGPLELDLVAGGGGRVPWPRPWWFTRWVEGPIARRLMGVEVHGTSPTGVEEWYQARGWRWVSGGTVRIAGGPAAPPGPPRPRLAVGFGEPPPQPSITDLEVRVRRARPPRPGGRRGRASGEPGCDGGAGGLESGA